MTYQKKLKNKYRRLGLCIECGGSPLATTIHCEGCREKAKNTASKTRVHRDPVEHSKEVAAWKSRSQKENPEKWTAINRHYHLRRAYGITEEQYNAQFEKQHGCCGACHMPLGGSVDPTVIDHKHGEQGWRGLVHRSCNFMLGLAKDNPLILRLAAEYLEQYEREKGRL